MSKKRKRPKSPVQPPAPAAPEDFAEALRAAMDILVHVAAIDAIKSTEIIFNRVRGNLDRARRLLNMQVGMVERGNPVVLPFAEDVLRSVVVFLHAAMEDFLRTIATSRYPTAAPEALNAVPLVGGTSGRAEKFTLGQLAAHRDKHVSDVIKDSVREWLNQRSFNNTTDIARLLSDIKLGDSEVPKFYPALDAMIRRRHLIVHQADMEDDGTVGGKLRRIDVSDVKSWLEACFGFTLAVISCLSREAEMTGHGDLDHDRKPTGD